jgi:hypothetical protein
MHIVLYDLSGRRCYESEQDNRHLDLSALKKGSYIGLFEFGVSERLYRKIVIN